MSNQRRVLLSCVLFASFAPACGGRSGLDDFSKGADPIITSGADGSNDTTDGSSDTTDGSNDTTDGSNDGSKPGSDGSAAVGSKCTKDSSCKGDDAECLTEVSVGGFFMLEFPEGYCAVQGCEEDDDCPKGAGCLNAIGMQVCLKTCEENDDCRTKDGYQCSSFGGMGGGGFGGGMGGGQPAASYCLPPFGGPMGGQGGGFGG